ncbi:MAG: hydrogenase maturation protease [Gemmatimonadota bacterium]
MRVVGVGNILLSDEGIGVHLVAALSGEGALAGVEYVDGGVMGAALLTAVEGADKVVILDTVAAPFPPGTVLKLLPEDLEGAPPGRFSVHDLALSDAIGLMRLRQTLPEMIILGVVPADVATPRVGLSDPLAARFGEILDKVRTEIDRFARDGIRRAD